MSYKCLHVYIIHVYLLIYSICLNMYIIKYAYITYSARISTHIYNALLFVETEGADHMQCAIMYTYI